MASNDGPDDIEQGDHHEPVYVDVIALLMEAMNAGLAPPSSDEQVGRWRETKRSRSHRARYCLVA